MRPLFVAGCGRSGTTALTRYLNQHESVLVCIERYKSVARKNITPELFTFDRILDYREGETNITRERHVKLLENKEPEKLKWIGDKTPNYVRDLEVLQKNNPGARFIVTYRPVEEVAESYDARSKDPEDAWLAGKNGFEIGVQDWNVAMRKTQEFIESGFSSNVLIVSYHDFFQGDEDCISQISRFLDLEFDGSTRDTWERMSRGFKRGQCQKELLSEDQMSFIRKNKDSAAEGWILDRIELQKKMSWPPVIGTPVQLALQDRVEELESRLAEKHLKARRLSAQVQRLEGQLQEIRNSNSWKLLRKINSIRVRVASKVATLLQRKLH